MDALKTIEPPEHHSVAQPQSLTLPHTLITSSYVFITDGGQKRRKGSASEVPISKARFHAEAMKSLPPSILFALLAASISRADIIRVPTDYETIQSAIEAAVAGDTIDVSAGTYQERLVLKPGIVVRSVGGNEKGKLGLTRAETTILDGGGDPGRFHHHTGGPLR